MKISDDMIEAMKKDGVDVSNCMARLTWLREQEEHRNQVLGGIRKLIDNAEEELTEGEGANLAYKAMMDAMPPTPAAAVSQLVSEVITLGAQTRTLLARVAVLEKRPERAMDYLGIDKAEFNEAWKKHRGADDAKG